MTNPADIHSDSVRVLPPAEPDSLAFQWKATLTREKRRLRTLVRGGGPESGTLASHMYSNLYDEVLTSWFESCRSTLGVGDSVSLAAVGSYGRGVLSPSSDLDIRILSARPIEASRDLVEALVYPLWDAGLDVGHQVVTIEELLELAKTDLTTATSLLDWRHLAGDTELGAKLVKTALETTFRGDALQAFVERLEAYNRSRHARFGDSIYLLEPNVKNGAGGLRDLDVAHWYARASYHVQDLSELVARGVLLESEWSQIVSAREYLLRLRNSLHLSVGRKIDRLTFDQQELLAVQLGYGSDGAAVEHLMSDYYRHARTIRRACETLTPRTRIPFPISTRETLEGGFVLDESGDLAFEREDALAQDPSNALRIYVSAIERSRPVAASARRLIARATSDESFCGALRDQPRSAELFRSLVCTIRETQLKADSILGELHDVGLLLAMFPEFLPVVGRVHHDTYHVYTVDVHSIAAVDHLRKLTRGDLLKEHGLACRLAAEHVRREVLFFATLLHDVGKVLGGGGHSERGALMAATMLKRLGFAPADIQDVQLLVRLHLSLYQAATRRDVEDPQTIRKVCGSLGSLELLRELYLLTIADVTTTSPTSMTAWKRDVLDDLYTHAERYLSAQSQEDTLPQVLGVRARIQLLAKSQSAKVSGFLSQFLNGLPERYLFANDLSTVIAHAEFALESQGQVSRIRCGARRAEYCELWVVADDRPGLLSLVAASFWRSKLSIMSAQVYTWTDDRQQRRSVDAFWVRHRSGEDVGEEDVEALNATLRDILENGLDEKAVTIPPPPSRPGGAPPIRTEVNIDNRSATDHSVIEVITQDRPNLLFWLSSKLAELGLPIWFAKINTEGARVADVFYVSDGDRGKVTDPERLEQIKRELVTVVERATNGWLT